MRGTADMARRRAKGLPSHMRMFPLVPLDRPEEGVDHQQAGEQTASSAVQSNG